MMYRKNPIPLSLNHLHVVVLSGMLILVALLLIHAISLIRFTDLVAKETILRSGGVLVVDDRRSAIDGLELSVPSNAFTRDEEIRIYDSKIDPETLPAVLDVITPLITVSYEGNAYTAKPLTMTIPIDIDTTTEFAMAFFYDPETNDLEAIPMIALSDEEIVIQSQHYESLLVSKIPLADLLAYAEEGIQTGYLPGVDDWQFTNYGSALTPGGQCAGLSLTSAYYYLTKTKQGEPSLWGRFDNDTPDFWYDDRDGYRFASVIQSEIDFTGQAYIDYVNNSLDDDTYVYYSFLYAMHVTGDPQFIAIYNVIGNTIYSGHAILAYGVEMGRLYVADPNYPGQTERFIPYSDITGFGIYNSGDNAQAIDDFGTIGYNTFIFVGMSALVDFDLLESNYAKLIDGTIGRYLMPTLSVEYMKTFSYVEDDVVWDRVGTPFTIPANYNGTVPAFLADRLRLVGTADKSTIVYTIYLNGEVYREDLTASDGNDFLIDILMASGENTVGILAEEAIGGYLYYADYLEFTFTYLK